MIFRINIGVVFQLEKLHLNLSHLFALECLHDINTTLDAIELPEGVIQTLVRKGYITEDKFLTTLGRTLYNTLSDPKFSSSVDIKKELKKVKPEKDSRYEEWLSHYPATATFLDYNDKKWISTRILRQNTIENEVAYLNILKEGIYTHQDLCNALEFQKDMIIEDSMRSGENKMTYFQGTTPYLNQKTYEKQIETMKLLKWIPRDQRISKTNKTVNSAELF